VHVLIVGAGIGGLATAVALRRQGFGAMVLERRSELREIGAGLTIWPNGVRALRALGTVPAEGAFELRTIGIKTWRGKTIVETDCSHYRDRYGAPALPMHRAELQRALLSALDTDAIVPSSQVLGFSEGQGSVSLEGANGLSWSGDLVVGADGLRSTIRRQLLADGEPRYTGVTVWRGVTGAHMADLAPGESWTFLGPGFEFGFMPMIDRRVYWFASKEAPARERAWAAGHRAELLERHEGWPHPVLDLIQSTDEADVVRTDIYDRPPARRWSGIRVTLLGDAAHPMTPHASQGACQALEDAVELAAALKKSSNIAAALALYEQRRVGPANEAVRASSLSGRVIRVKHPLARWLLDSALARIPVGVRRQQEDRLLRSR
jgi:2-polyprenyl-6-methoxyphenol hydroxylase-like FAD-dependent oxidoreductase